MPEEPNEPAVARVLVLLAARNGAPWIERQIASVLSQQGVTVQLQVRDDDSSDDTRAIVAAVAARDARVRLVADHAATGSAAGNFFRLIAGAQASDCDAVAFCDQDDEWNPDKLARAVARLAAARADGYSAATQARWANGREKRLSQDPNQRAADYLFEGAGQGCTFVVTARLFTALQASLDTGRALVASIHYHDWMTYAVARSLGMSWTFDAQAVMSYHQHAGNDTGARSSTSGVVRRLAQIRLGWYRAQVNAVVALVLCINPGDPHARRWRMLDGRRALSARAARAWFVAVDGRRRLSDRLVQVAAALAGYL